MNRGPAGGEAGACARPGWCGGSCPPFRPVKKGNTLGPSQKDECAGMRLRAPRGRSWLNGSVPSRYRKDTRADPHRYRRASLRGEIPSLWIRGAAVAETQSIHFISTADADSTTRGGCRFPSAQPRGQQLRPLPPCGRSSQTSERGVQLGKRRLSAVRPRQTVRSQWRRARGRQCTGELMPQSLTGKMRGTRPLVAVAFEDPYRFSLQLLSRHGLRSFNSIRFRGSTKILGRNALRKPPASIAGSGRYLYRQCQQSPVNTRTRQDINT